MSDIEDANMFCFQCEQTENGKGCTIDKGICGKTAPVAALQDLLIDVVKKVGSYASLGRLVGYINKEVDRWILDALFTTLTNVNFDEARLDEYLRKGAELLKMAKEGYLAACREKVVSPLAVPDGDWEYKPDLKALIAEGRLHAINKQKEDWDITSTRQLALYGLKGSAVYYFHAARLGAEDNSIYEEFHKLIRQLTQPMTLEETLWVAVKVGELNLKVLDTLDKANTSAYGVPDPTQVRISPVKGKCILVSGHDLKDLEILLKQTADKGINVYTHGEMLPCNAYPGLKAYKHLVGHYGGAWQNQKTDFQKFPGAILMTTNCIIEPRKTYIHRIFTRSAVAFPGVAHIKDDNMAPVIEAALKEPGFTEDAPKKEITIGFSHRTVLSLAGTIVDAVKKGAIKHFFFIGGCDGTETERSYFTDFAKAVPHDCIILTAGCGKYRVNCLDLGFIDFEGTKIPRLLDVGQCNDSYGAVRIALALADAFKVGVNDLPLSLVVSWFEQKAVAVLLTLLHLGVKNITLGPRLPAFISPKVLEFLVKTYAVRPISNVKDDMEFLLHKTDPKK